MDRRISVIVMPGTMCNLRCKYCYMHACETKEGRMKEDALEKFIRNCSEGYDFAYFCWHAGEPLLMGMDFYKKVVDVQQKETHRRGIKFENAMQSNGTLMTQEWMAFLKENNFRVGISFDAPSEIMMMHRGFSAERMIKIVRDAKECFGSIGVICAISEYNVEKGEEIFQFFQTVGVSSYSLLPVKQVPLIDCPKTPSVAALSNLYMKTFDLWLDRENEFVCIEPLTSMMRALIGEHPGLCSLAQPCMKRMVAIDYQGNVLPCGSINLEEFILGNIFQSPLQKILREKRVEELRNIRNKRITRMCKGCEWIAVCRGGCISDAYWNSGKIDGDNPFCFVQKEVFGYMRKRLDGMLKKSL